MSDCYKKPRWISQDRSSTTSNNQKPNFCDSSDYTLRNCHLYNSYTMTSPYTREQVSQYLNYIDIPSQYRLEKNPECSYEFLKAIHIHMISAIPYENLAIHYSATRTVLLDPQRLFDKIVGNARGRGGYCMENSLFALYMLRGLGFKVYPAGVKIRYRHNGIPQGSYIG